MDTHIHFAPVRVAASRSDELDPIAELTDLCDVLRSDGADSLNRDVLRPDEPSESERGEDRELVGDVVAVHVARRIRLGKAERLRFRKRRGEVGSLFLHPREDEVGRAVEDACDG